MHLIIVTGMSGAGKSHVLKKLEDLGYYCVDNLPAALIMDFVNLCMSLKKSDLCVAIGVDCREEISLEQIYEKIDGIKEKNIQSEILYMDAPDDVLIKRFKETRRSHPLSRNGWLEEGITTERQTMKRLRDMADVIINTGGLRPSELYAKIEKMYGGENSLTLFIMSFGFKYGLPLDADYVFDLRFLPNPYWVEQLRAQTGLDQPVVDYIMAEESAPRFLDDLEALFKQVVPGFIKEGRKQVVLAFGCTGGRHRSVCMAARFAAQFSAVYPNVELMHRDISVIV